MPIAGAPTDAVHDLPQQRFDVDRRGLFRLQPGVDLADLPHPGEEPLHAGHLPLDQGDEARAVLRVFDLGQQLGRGADRGEGVLELVRHVGSEGFEGVLVRFEAGGEPLQGSGEVADLVRPPGAAEPAAQPAAAVEQGVGSSRSRRTGWVMVPARRSERTAAAKGAEEDLEHVSRTWSSSRRMRTVDCDTSTAPAASPPSRTGMAL